MVNVTFGATSTNPKEIAILSRSVLRILQELAVGVEVPRDLSVVGFDDIEDCAQVWPGLTTVSCGIDRFGQVMAETVLAWLEEGKPPPAEALSPVKLILRASTND